MITEDYVSFEIAKLLKEKGFDGKCAHVWVEEKGNKPICMGMSSFVEGEEVADRETVEAATDYANEYMFKNLYVAYLCPTLQMAMKWLREVHNQIIIPNVRTEDPISGIINCYIVGIWYIPKNNGGSLCFISPTPENGYSTYEQACEAAIKYCLENLI